MGIVDRGILVVHSISNLVAALALLLCLDFAADSFRYVRLNYEEMEPTVTKVAGNIDSGVKLMREGIAVGKEGVEVIRNKRLFGDQE